jgi:hypothetical protein
LNGRQESQVHNCDRRLQVDRSRELLHRTLETELPQVDPADFLRHIEEFPHETKLLIKVLPHAHNLRALSRKQKRRLFHFAVLRYSYGKKTRISVENHVPEGIKCNHHYHIVGTIGNRQQGADLIVSQEIPHPARRGHALALVVNAALDWISAAAQQKRPFEDVRGLKADQKTIVHVIDSLLRDAKAKKAYASQ